VQPKTATVFSELIILPITSRAVLIILIIPLLRGLVNVFIKYLIDYYIFFLIYTIGLSVTENIAGIATAAIQKSHIKICRSGDLLPPLVPQILPYLRNFLTFANLVCPHFAFRLGFFPKTQNNAIFTVNIYTKKPR
jgi:hypothetical protein